MKKIDVIVHPVRFRILQALQRQGLTTQEIGEELADVPNSSIYRHLKLLLKHEIIQVTETRLVNGIQEKRYGLVGGVRLSAEELLDLSADEHLGYFTTFVMTLLQGFNNYLQTGKAPYDFHADFVGYTEARFWANREEMEALQGALNAALIPLLENQKGGERKQYKMAIVNHPILGSGEEE
ncbi:MAG TPA: helix-turn-helix domain-containing protein [Anaerolineae bacterium]|nr:helix-turn-helix domain-containing protein [Anaerolineae bacterium]